MVVPGFPADYDDDCTPAIARWVRDLASEAHVDVWTLQWPQRTGTWRAFGATVHGCARTGPGSGLRAVPIAVRGIIEAHRIDPYDEIRGVWAEEAGLAAVLAARAIGVPSIVSAMGVEFAGPEDIAGRRAWRRSLARRVVAAADRVEVPSNWLAERCPAPCVVRPLRVDVDLFRRPKRSSAGPRLLCVASLVPSKGVHDVLVALPLARQRVPGITLDIVGDGPMRRDLERVAGTLGGVRFLGHVRYANMPDVYATADVLVHASHWESQGLVIDEALLSGLRVVATRVGRAAELPDAVAVGDLSALADAIVRAVSS